MDLNKTLDLIGQQTSLHLKEKVKTGSFASGALFNSFRYEVTTSQDAERLTVYADDTFFFVTGGRRPGGKMPPEQSIKDWIRLKGIEDSALWPIRRSIAEKGIRPKPYLKDWIAAKETSWQKLLGDSAVIDLTAQFTERFKNLIPKAA